MYMPEKLLQYLWSAVFWDSFQVKILFDISNAVGHLDFINYLLSSS